MNIARSIAWLLLTLTVARAAAATSPSYSIDEEVLGQGGGGPIHAGVYNGDVSLGSFIEIGAALSITSRCGYIGQLNEPPAPRNDSIERAPNSSVQLSISKLLANDLDLEGDTLRLTLPSANTSLGGTLNIAGDMIQYTPPAGPLGNATDLFTYLALDGFGGSNEALVFIVVADP